jgi:spermidine synthase
MLARILIDSAEVPGGGTLRLIRRGDEWSIMLGANELMNSRLSGSEEALAELTLGALTGGGPHRILIGGLGMGFTLRAALAALPANAQVVVAELVQAVAGWARGPMAHLFNGSLDDPRVEVRVADVAALIGAARQHYNAILLDVDNGPDAISTPGNDRLYADAGLKAALAALRPGGILSIWSSAPDDAFTRRLARAGFAVEQRSVRARASGRGAHHVIWLARRPPRRA